MAGIRPLPRIACSLLVAGSALLVAPLPGAALTPIGTNGYQITTVAGNGTAGYKGFGTAATSAELYEPFAVATDAHGNFVIADLQNSAIRVVAEQSGTFYGQAMTAGDIYSIAGTGVAGYSGDGGPATSAELSYPKGVAIDGHGNVVVLDFSNERVRVIAEAAGTFYGKTMTAGDIYTIAGNGTAGFTGDGGAATAAELHYPEGIGIDASGNAVISDSGNLRVRIVAGSTGTFYGQAMTEGDIYTIAGSGSSGFSGDGGPAVLAAIAPAGLAIDAAGNIIIADNGNERVRVVAVSTAMYYGQSMTAGDIYSIAGTGTASYSGDGGPAISATFSGLFGVAIDSSGNVILCDGNNNRIRAIAESTSTMYTIAMTAGDVYTIAGNGTGGYGGDGGAPVSAELNLPVGVTTNDQGNVIIADSSNNRIRELVPVEYVQSTAVIGAGTLSFASAPGNVAFAPATLTGTDQTATATEILDIGDNTGSGSGWNVTLSNTTFTSGSHTLLNSDFTAALPGVPSCDSGVTCTAATWSGSVSYPYALPGSSATKMLSAASATGLGNQTVSIIWSEKIPAASFTGTYSSTWTLTLVSGP